MRVLQVACQGLGNGGVQSVIMNISRNLPNVQTDILVFTKQKGYHEDEFKELGGNIYRIPHYEGDNRFRRQVDYYIRFFRILFGTYKILKKNGKYDLIHCHNDLESAICNLAAYFAGVKLRISHSHTASNKFPKKFILPYLYRKTLQKLMNKSSNVKLGCSQESFISIFGEKHLLKATSYIIPNSIDLKKFSRSESNQKEKKDFNIVHVGRYENNKNQLFILELMPYILKRIDNLKLKLIGEGSYRKLLEDKIKELDLQEKVQLLASDSNVKEVLEEADLFILPSKREGFGIVLLEAQAMEVPCLVSNTVPMIVDCGLCEFLSLDEDKELWADHAMKILEGKHDKKINKEKLRNFDLDKYVLFVKSLYEGKRYESWDAYISQGR